MKTWPFPSAADNTKASKPTRPVPGRGTRLTVSAFGFALSAPGKRQKFNHPFRPGMSGTTAVIFSRGLVEMREPTIGGVPISGATTKAPPVLKLEPGKANKRGESWACVEVHPDAEGKLPEESKIEIVHTNEPVSLEPEVGRCPIALILWRDRIPVRVVPIVHFNLRYLRVVPLPGAGAVRHLFL